MVAKWLVFNQNLWLSVPVITAGALIYFGNTVLAQVTSDQTLGKESSVVTPVNPNVDRIDGGAVRGSNLFHSFKDFNVGQGRRVDFANPAGIENIFSRVTRGNRSDILGTLGVLGNANLFLLNPNGIIFGPNARLDIKGSFVGTTAESIKFADESFFSASNPQEVPLLKISIPIGLQMGSQPGRIENSAKLSAGKTLGLIGGEVVLDGGILFTNESPIELAALTANIKVEIHQNDSSPLGFKFSENAAGSAINLINGALVAAQGNSDIKLFGGEVTLDGGSRIRGINGATINIDATQFSLDNDSALISLNQSTGNGGDIQVHAQKQVNIRNSRVSSGNKSSATGDGGDIRITGQDINVIGNGSDSDIDRSFVQNWTEGQGNAGGITLSTSNSINVADNASISVATSGAGNTGNLILQAKNEINFTNNPDLTVFTSGAGNTGDLSIKTGSLSLSNMLQTGIASMSSGSGTSGSISIQADEMIEMNDARLFAQAASQNSQAGDISIQTRKLQLQDGGSINADTIGSGTGGNISIQASESVNINGNSQFEPQWISRITSQTALGATGNAGNITIETPQLTVAQGGSIDTSSLNSSGNAGNISIYSESVNINGSSQFDPLQISAIQSGTSEGSGNGGNINIETSQLSITQGGEISTSSISSSGNAGNITIRAKDVELDGFVIIDRDKFDSLPDGLFATSQIFATVVDGLTNDVEGGEIIIDTERLRLSNGASLKTSLTGGRGKAGNLVVRATDSIDISGVALRNRDGLPLSSGLFAEVQTGVIPVGDNFAQTGAIGVGGNIEVETGRLSLNNGGQISGSSFAEGDAGNILINANKIDMRGKRTAIVSQIGTEAIGNAGRIDINTQELNLENGAFISSVTFGQGNGGDLIINADNIFMADASLENAVLEGAKGDGGNLQITTNRLSLTDQAWIVSFTLGDGKAGSIFVDAKEKVKLDDLALISVASISNGTAGNININSPSLQLFNNSSIIAETNSQDGGNIGIENADLVLLRQGSRISATAGEGGDGGNIDINSKFIITFPQDNSDITANAFEGQGGKINIASEKIFWMEQRDREELIDLLGSSSELNPNLLSTNDITAFSQQNPNLGGLVTINLLSTVDPSRGLTSLPTAFVDPSELIDQTCSLSSTKSSSQFVNTGRGGLPINPSNPLNPDTTVRRLAVPIAWRSQSSSSSSTIPLPNNQEPESIVEAQGWVRLGNGKIRLVAQTPSVTPQGNWQNTASCSR